MKKKSEIPTWEEIRQMQANNARAFEEVALRFKESQAEADRRFEEAALRSKDLDRKFEESRAEADRKFEEVARGFKETERFLKSLGKQFGGVSQNIGHHAEQYFKDSLKREMTFCGVKYDIIHLNWKVGGKKGSAEFDIVLENGKSFAIIEAKNRIHPNFLDELINKKATAFRKIFPKYANYALYLGVAGFSFDDEVISRAKEKGIGVLKQVGNSVEAEQIVLRAY